MGEAENVWWQASPSAGLYALLRPVRECSAQPGDQGWGKDSPMGGHHHMAHGDQELAQSVDPDLGWVPSRVAKGGVLTPES